MDIGLLIVIIIGVVLILYIIVTFNQFARMEQEEREAFSTMDIYLKKRWDLIPKLVDVVKGYAKHEKDTLTEIVKSRSGVYDEMSQNEKITKNTELSHKVDQIKIISEAYPDLKSNENYDSLSKELSKIEDEIAQSRKYYNAIVRDFNIKVKTIPSSIIAKLFNYEEKAMYMIDDEERKDVKVNL